ncbi:MAG: hypothetical protein KDK30_03080 [Leptospiraceae bacterium]|nr:hypothetical protein [Leptospiraceae bacterium]
MRKILVLLPFLIITCASPQYFDLKKDAVTNTVGAPETNGIIIGKVEDLDGGGKPGSYTSWYHYTFVLGGPPHTRIEVNHGGSATSGTWSDMAADDDGYFIFHVPPGTYKDNEHKFLVVQSGGNSVITWTVLLSPEIYPTEAKAGTITVLPIISIDRNELGISGSDRIVQKIDLDHERSEEVVEHFRKVHPSVFESHPDILYKEWTSNEPRPEF